MIPVGSERTSWCLKKLLKEESCHDITEILLKKAFNTINQP